MKLHARYNTGRQLRRLRSMDSAIREAALNAASEALREEVSRVSGTAVDVSSHASRRAVGSTNPADAVREFGTLEQTPSPWLAPVLPLALEPMRAAARTAAARAASVIGKRKK